MKKLFVTITLLFALVGSASALDLSWDFIKYGTFEDENVGVYTVLIDLEATKPYDIEKENIMFLLYLQKQERYRDITVYYYNPEGESLWCKEISEKHKIYCTIEVYEDYDYICHVCNDGSVIEYLCIKNKEEE